MKSLSSQHIIGWPVEADLPVLRHIVLAYHLGAPLAQDGLGALVLVLLELLLHALVAVHAHLVLLHPVEARVPLVAAADLALVFEVAVPGLVSRILLLQLRFQYFHHDSPTRFFSYDSPTHYFIRDSPTHLLRSDSPTHSHLETVAHLLLLAYRLRETGPLASLPQSKCVVDVGVLLQHFNYGTRHFGALSVFQIIIEMTLVAY